MILNRIWRILALMVGLQSLGQASAGEPTPLTVSQVGLHFICTADGQPDMYSWRLPIQDTSPTAQVGDYIIPEIAPEDFETSYLISGGRTALEVDENVLNTLEIKHEFAVGFDGINARITNLETVGWRDSGFSPVGSLKKRYYSNYPPLSDPDQAGRYGTTMALGSVNYGRKFQIHPGYDWRNWNWTLDVDRPLEVSQKRIQAMLHLELHHPPTSDSDADLDYTIIIPAQMLNGILVNGRSVFTTDQDAVFKVIKSNFVNATTGESGSLADSRMLSLRRRVSYRRGIREDLGYNSTVIQGQPSGVLNMDLVSTFFTVDRNQPLIFSSDNIEMKIYNSLTISSDTEEAPLQTVVFKLPSAQAPTPDLVVAGSYAVSYTQPSGTPFYHPAVQAPRWWGFHRDGVLARSYYQASQSSLLGRFYEWPRVTMTSEISAKNPISNSQRVPGARALIYGYDPVLYPDVGKVSVADLLEEPLKRIEYEAPSFNRPLHFGSDTVRTLSCVNALVPKTEVTEADFIPHPDYNNPEVHLAYGRGFDLPDIQTQPTPEPTLTAGDPLELSVAVKSTTEVHYQWRLKGNDIPGADQSTYQVPHLSKTMEGTYDVVVTNLKGTEFSEPTVLMVDSVRILDQPVSQTVSAGGSATLSVNAEGETLTYQWRRNSQVIPKATAPTLALSKVKQTDQGLYDVIVSSPYETEVSEAVPLTVTTNLAIVQQPIGGIVRPDRDLHLQVRAAGAGVIAYQWRLNGAIIDGATTDRWMVDGNAESDPSGNYDVVVSNGTETVTSAKAKVTFKEAPPRITQQPVSVAVEVGTEATFEIQAEGADLKYQWRFNGNNLVKAKAATLFLNQALKNQAGVYDCVVSNAHGSTLSLPATLTVGAALNFTTLPENQVVAPGSTATFTAVAGEEGEAVAYQWQFNGKPLAGAIYNTLTVPLADATLVGVYTVTATLGDRAAVASAWLKLSEPGLLIYKLNGTGQSFAGTEATRVTLSGYLLVEPSAQPPEAALLLVAKDGRFTRFLVRPLENFRLDSTGPAPKTQTVYSSVHEGAASTWRSLFWLQGQDSLIVLSRGADQAVAPKTLTGFYNQVQWPEVTEAPALSIDRINFKASLDIPSSALSRQNAETLDAALTRLSVELQQKGYLETPEAEDEEE
ncbi:MAG: immunoglobulin domain-containing protein [Prosthecobacter sp.]|nr:immunoglobulin domain-containing protein [Prosthecobacter sp.]